MTKLKNLIQQSRFLSHILNQMPQISNFVEKFRDSKFFIELLTLKCQRENAKISKHSALIITGKQ
jgi:hypothetical protein